MVEKTRKLKKRPTATLLVTIGVQVPPPVKEAIKEMADAEMNTMSRVTLRLLKESPTLRQMLGEAEANAA